ncbi:MAG: NAD/NADP octopine/nopaline dehydrogenase family protein, partial [Deltaproteobacteria bacterium]|nr:NAD/NADP octopine/nopaline dehydrogenase family protein [Deltaproteobacteria bacterium]
MARIFYTESDIDAFHGRGQSTVEVGEQVVLTAAARERAAKLGIRLTSPGAAPPPGGGSPSSPPPRPEAGGGKARSGPVPFKDSASAQGKTRGNRQVRVAVLGAGHGGLATAGHIALRGQDVSLFSFFKRELDAVRERGGVELDGDVEGTAKLGLVTGDLDEAVAGRDLVIVLMPALAQKNVASLLCGCLKDGQTVLLSPGRTGGALEVYQTFRRYQCQKRVVLAECQTMLYATESRGPAHVEVMKAKNRVRAAALPATDNHAFFDVMGSVYPEYVPATNVLETSINNTGAVVHPAPMLMNSGLLERAAAGEDIRYYRDVITKFVCDNVMTKIDREKSAIAEALGVPVLDILAWYRECYGVEGGTLYETLQQNEYYIGFSAPKHVLGYHH